MKKVLIVDDEPVIREGLPYIIDWQEYGFEIVGAAQNGKEGIKLINEYQPDLVITDIRMPEMDGLEMIQTAQKRGETFYSIILSGYSEFTYAQKAIRLGTVSYLLKPIDEDELTDILLGIRKEVDKQKGTNNDIYHLLRKNIFEGDFKPYTLEYRLACLIRFPNQSIAREFQTRIRENKNVLCYLFTHDDYTYALTLILDDFDLDTVEKELLSIASQEGEVILQSSWQNKSSHLKQLYKEIRKLKDITFSYANLGVISNERIKSLQAKTHFTGNITEQLLKDILYDGDLANSLFKYKENFRYHPLHENEIKWNVSKELQSVVNNVIDTINPTDRERLQEVANTAERSIARSRTMEQLMKEMENSYRVLQQIVNESFNRINTIQEIERYTQKHYKEDLNLKIISEHFNYNNAYIGKKFKKETGKSYSQYLDEIRMGKAKQLLKDSNLMIYEIAERTGYANLDYFYKKFKRHCGMSPNEYRKLQGNG
jgi:two-component system, response regulator YesN